MTRSNRAADPADQAIDPTTASQAVIDAVAVEIKTRAFLHDDPAAYRAGARDALAAVERMTDHPSVPAPPLTA